MNTNKSFSILLDIFENYRNGDISKNEYSFLLYEMKTRQEYAERHFKQTFSFIPISSEANGHLKRGIVSFDGWMAPVDIVSSDTISINGIPYPADTRTVLTTGKIILTPKILLKLKSNRFRDAVIYHEIGHSRLQSQAPIPEPTLNYDVLVNIICDIINASPKAPNRAEFRSEDEYESVFIEDYFLPLLDKYRRRLENSTVNNRSDILARYRAECIEILKKYELGGHTNSSEFEADRYAANRIGTQIFVKTLKRLLKETIKDEKKKISEKDS